MSQEKQPIPHSKKNQSKSNQYIPFNNLNRQEDFEATLDHLKIAQHMDDLRLFQLADEFDGLM